MADEIKLFAVAAKPCVGVPIVTGDALHLGLGHGAVVVLLAIAAPPTTRFLLVNLHCLTKCHPVGFVRSWLV